MNDFLAEEENEQTEKMEEKNPMLLKLLKQRTILIYGEITQELAKTVTEQLLYLSAINDDPITMFINSQGGHVESGDTIHDVIRFIKPKVKMIGTGWVASAGITIYLAADKKDRYSLPNTRYMIHQPAGGVQGQSTEIQIEAKEILRMRKRVNKLIAKATGQTLEKIEQDTDRNFWLSAEEAKDYGIVGKIVESDTAVK
ncbi:ATP-dependent Clp protease proteolytic subunit [Enterococcus hulanensis]|uniref:ATP-dependent Clp protease proteolytic subunit n=1 Tax=Enterococcus hulanensis TaxID=2559929 RepID=A0ABU3F061_9ENTE|nr:MULTISPECIES: ATP-dependent Clp protease proteolytic subunit [Enterococcus]MBO0411764.1 ATP-dependent Clp protease proteolytic subunit [Enterococcus hulanensis]MBO0456126.1 ATP-dependent Clp protease proteolytic subunit [Enterococcus hulanensis]MBX8936380.1 ATP-dependent Clp protease proteolytic subunit [Enterococcus gilvus]MDT2600520.1 ATP-dependent Clp protease proteolytic subunit [Enterococcus hulanensis]MDT2609742.1 ATP-dependent Clp protease proteolytic subunit [Enterococcus hulanensis